VCLAQALQRTVVAAQDDVFLARQQNSQRLVSHRRCTVSTLNEIAANHARMAKLMEEESMRLSAIQSQIVGSIEIPSTQPAKEMSLHFLTRAPEHVFAEAVL
jgi:hypothetical protein